MDLNSVDSTDDCKIEFDFANPMCRCCLSSNKRMFSALDFENIFNDLASISVSQCDGVPQWICYECCALLQRAVRFKHKILKAHTILYNYLARCAPFPIDAEDPELKKYASPQLRSTDVLIVDCNANNTDFSTVFSHTNPESASDLDAIEPTLSVLDKTECNYGCVKDEIGISDYEDNVALYDLKSAQTATDDDLDTLLQGSVQVKVENNDIKKKRKSKKKLEKVKKRKETDNLISESEQPPARKEKLQYDTLSSDQVNNNKKERQKRYREQNRDKLKQRERERRRRLHYTQSISEPISTTNSIELNNEEIISGLEIQRNKEINALQKKRQRQQRYREQNRDKLKQREAYRRRRQLNPEDSPNIEFTEIILEPIIVIDEIHTHSQSVGLGEMQRVEVSKQNERGQANDANVTEIPNNYSQFRYD